MPRIRKTDQTKKESMASTEAIRPTAPPTMQPRKRWNPLNRVACKLGSRSTRTVTRLWGKLGRLKRDQRIGKIKVVKPPTSATAISSPWLLFRDALFEELRLAGVEEPLNPNSVPRIASQSRALPTPHAIS